MSTAPVSASKPDPAVIFDLMNAYQRSAAMKAAIELDLFSAISTGSATAKEIAANIGATERGVRILCDYLVINNLLLKEGNRYSLGINAATFLDRNSPACFASAIKFLQDPRLAARFDNLAQTVRTGLQDEGTVSHENPLWVEFARNMAPMIFPSAMDIAEMLAGDAPLRVLDIAAGHGLFGISIARRNPNATITALDWPSVLAVARENAQKFGVSDRHSTIEGDAFQVEFGGPYDMVLVTNFFHHFDRAACEGLMRKILSALAPGGRCVTLDFVPNEDRVSPPAPASFAMNMLGGTPRGDAYIFAEYDSMFRSAGFGASTKHDLPRGPQSVIVTQRA
jgi:2-polyprenyl-3-methyl-5-hydroxy-6-metoxy-1,4-benzoquinol methylase